MNGQLKIKKYFEQVQIYDHFKCMFLLGLAEQAIEFHCCNPMHSHLHAIQFHNSMDPVFYFFEEEKYQSPHPDGGIDIFLYIPYCHLNL